MTRLDSVAVLGLGKVGRLAARLLFEDGIDVVGHDLAAAALLAGDDAPPYPVQSTDVGDHDALTAALDGRDAVLSCLPFEPNIAVAEAAHTAGTHYFDLTEDVATTARIRELSATSRGLMAPQCGLAPGFVGIVGAAMAEGLSDIRSIRMRVGALPQHPTGLLGYAFNWSPEGVVNEYLNDCEVIEDGVRKWVSSMEWLETIYVHGTRLEAALTSGGLGTMCETYAGRVQNLDYKTMRYPGHVALMNFFFHELLLRERRDLAGEILTHAKPPVNDDVVHVHVAAEGSREGRMVREEFVRSYRPLDLADGHRTAIAWTTAGSVVAVMEMVRAGVLPDRGFLHQEHVPLDGFLATPTGKLFETAGQ